MITWAVAVIAGIIASHNKFPVDATLP